MQLWHRKRNLLFLLCFLCVCWFIRHVHFSLCVANRERSRLNATLFCRFTFLKKYSKKKSSKYCIYVHMYCKLSFVCVLYVFSLSSGHHHNVFTVLLLYVLCVITFLVFSDMLRNFPVSGYTTVSLLGTVCHCCSASEQKRNVLVNVGPIWREALIYQSQYEAKVYILFNCWSSNSIYFVFKQVTPRPHVRLFFQGCWCH